MTSDSVQNGRIPLQARRRPPLLRFGRRAPLTADEQIDELARSPHLFMPAIEHRLGRRNSGSQLAQDVWQNALIRMDKRLRDEERPPVDNVHAYMMRTCANCALDELRRVKRRSEVLVGEKTFLLDDRDGAVPLDDSALGFADAFDGIRHLLTEMEQQALVLTAFEDLTGKRAAELMGVKPGAVRKALDRVRKKIDKHPGLGTRQDG